MDVSQATVPSSRYVDQVSSSHSSTKPLSTPQIDPIIVLIDMDCFYVQVELRREPEFRGQPACVVQYKTRHKGGGIIALSYEARAKGVKRLHHGDEAREVCPEIKVFVVPELNGKADLTRYREAGAEVIQVLMKRFATVERASIDEAFVDLTAEVSALLPRYLSGELILNVEQLGATCVAGSDCLESWLNRTQVQLETSFTVEDQKKNLNNFALAIAAKLINESRQDILETTQFHCSAGITYSKTLSKLACGMNKPRKQTVLPADAVGALFAKTNISDVRFLGGKLGKLLTEHLGITTMGQLCQVTKANLLRYFDLKTAEWLLALSVGHDGETVQAREQPKSIGCSKNFMGKDALKTREDLQKWLTHFCNELSVRLKKDQGESNRTATLLTVYLTYLENGLRKQISRCAPMTSYERDALAKDAFIVADKCLTGLGYEEGVYTHHLVCLGITASKMKDGQLHSSNRIESYFNKSPKKEIKTEEVKTEEEQECLEGDGLDGSPSKSERGSRSPEKSVLEDAFKDDECQIISVTPQKSSSSSSFFSKTHCLEEQSSDVNVVLPECLPTTSGSLQPDCEPPWDELSPGEATTDIKTNYQTEILLHPEFKVHRCFRCGEMMWYPSMKVEHDDYHMALDLSEERPPQDCIPRKKLKLSDVVVTKSKKTSTTKMGTLDRFLAKKPI